MKTRIVIAALCFIVLHLASADNLLGKQKIKKIKARPEKKLNIKIDEALYCVENNTPFDFNDLADTYEYVNGRYDCSDFRLQSMFRLLYDEAGKVPEDAKAEMKKTILGFKYWMDQPGEDAMCYWSENHQILFATSEYLAGQLFPDEIFTNDGKTGAEHIEIGKKRILSWLEQRWLYGFTEWYSNTYYVEDIAPISNLIDFAKDEEISKKASIIMDLLLYDLATQSYKGTFISSSGRCYERGKKSNEGNSMKTVTESIWGTPWGYNYEDRKGMDQNFLYIDKYKVPEVIRQIGLDTTTTIQLSSNGLYLKELKKEKLNGRKTPQIMMQWAMEGFTNPEVIKNSVWYIHNHHMLSSEFLYDFKMIDLWILKVTGLLPTVSRILNPVTNGTAIQRANVYNYKTPDYMLVTAQDYFPGGFGDQHHIWNATISDRLSIFTTHPAKALSEKGALSGSPGYWVGNGRNPHSAQYKNISMSIYKIPKKKAFMEKHLVHETHAFFPSEEMDTTIIDGNYAFGKYGNVCFAFTAKNELHYADSSSNDLLQDGAETYWIFEISTMNKEGDLVSFMKRIKGNKVNYEKNRLEYNSNSQHLSLKFKGDFVVNGKIQQTEYPRFDSKYATVQRKPENITISFEGLKLFLDFYNLKREEL